MLPSPQGGAGRLLHTRSIAGLFIPFTDVPASVLPVYASSGTLPYLTHDSVPDCWLRFVRAAIADGWTVCACKAQPPQNGACDFHRTPLKHLKGPLQDPVGFLLLPSRYSLAASAFVLSTTLGIACAQGVLTATFLVTRHQMEVCPLSRGAWTPIRLMTRRPSLPPSSFTRRPIGLPYGSLTLLGERRAYHVPAVYLHG